MKYRTVDIRVEIEDRYNADDLIAEIGHNFDWIRSGVELRNDGWGHLLPDEDNKHLFILDDPKEFKHG